MPQRPSVLTAEEIRFITESVREGDLRRIARAQRRHDDQVDAMSRAFWRTTRQYHRANDDLADAVAYNLTGIEGLLPEMPTPSPSPEGPSMPRPLQIDNAVLGHVLTDNDVGIFTRLANFPSNLPEQVTAVTTATARFDGRISALERENAQLRDALRVVTEQMHQTLAAIQSLRPVGVASPPPTQIAPVTTVRQSPGHPTEAPAATVSVPGGAPQHAGAPSGSGAVAIAARPVDAGVGGAVSAGGATAPTAVAAGVPAAGAATPVRGADVGTVTAAHPTLDALRGTLQAYAQRHGVENARRFMQGLGFNSVGSVPADQRHRVIEAIRAAGELPIGAAVSTPAAG